MPENLSYDDRSRARRSGVALIASVPPAAPLAPLWRASCPTQRMVLMTDASARRLIGYELRPDGPILVDLGRTPPDVSPAPFDAQHMFQAMDFKLCLRNVDVVMNVKKQAAALGPSTAGTLLRNLTRVPNPKPLTVVLALFQFEELGPSATAETTRTINVCSESQLEFTGN